MNTALAETRTRDEILSEIAEHERTIARLRAELPSSIKQFYLFRGKPFRTAIVYAENLALAQAKLIARLADDYGPQGYSILGKVDELADAHAACSASPGSLMRSLSPSDAKEFLADWHADRAGRATSGRPKNYPKSRLEMDIEAFEYAERVKEREG